MIKFREYFSLLSGLCWLAVLAAPAPLLAKENLAGPVPATVERVIDGDTLVVRARIWLGQEIIVRVRLANVDTPELSRPRCKAERLKAEAAKAFVEQMIGPGAVTLYDIHNGKYAGRVVARVFTKQGDLATALKAANFDGDGWC